MMFGRKKKSSVIQQVDDSRYLTNDFKLRSTAIGIYESYRAQDYRRFPKLEEEEMLPFLTERLNKLFAGQVDSANGNMLDNTILAIAKEALIDLNLQRIDHNDVLRRLIRSRIADRESIRRVLENRKSELESLEKDYATVLQLCSQSKEV